MPCCSCVGAHLPYFTGGLALKTYNFIIMNDKVSNRYELYDWTDKLGWKCIARGAIGGCLLVIYHN